MHEGNCTNVEYRELDPLGFFGYRVGNDGSIWTNSSGHWKRMKPGGKRYLHVMLCPGRVTRGIGDLVLTLFVGPRPVGMQVCHFPNKDINDNRLCNLRWGTAKSNQADRLIHGTNLRGDDCPASVLTSSQVIEIRKRYSMGGVTLKYLGEEYGVTKHAIFRVVKLLNWKHVPDTPTP